jgi:hypothetical protein
MTHVAGVYVARLSPSVVAFWLCLLVTGVIQSGCTSTRSNSGSDDQTPSPHAQRKTAVTTWTTSSPGQVTIWFQNQTASATEIVYHLELTDCVNIIVPTTGQACGPVFAPRGFIELTPRGAGLGREPYRLDIPARDPSKPSTFHYTFHVDPKSAVQF